MALLPLLLLLAARVSLTKAAAAVKDDELYSVCTMRIIVDQSAMDFLNRGRDLMELYVEEHVNALNFIYEKNVRVKGQSSEKNRQLKFVIKDGDLQFRDAKWCADNPGAVSCKSTGDWDGKESTDFLKDQRNDNRNNHNDVCLLYFFIGHKFTDSETIGLAFVDRLCKGSTKANMGFVLFNDKTNNDKQSVETKFVFAHEVGHNLGLYHDGIGNGDSSDQFTKIAQECKRPYNNLMAPTSDHDFDKTNVQLSSCSKKMFEYLPRKVCPRFSNTPQDSDWACLVDEEQIYFLNNDSDSLVVAFVVVVLLMLTVIVVLAVLLCHPR